MKEVKAISTDKIRTLYESMTKNRAALELLSIGVVHGISTVVQPPCEDPRTLYESMTKNRAALELLSIGVVHGISTVVQPPCEDPSPF
ncbi:MAG: hypothetical protein ACTSR9_15155 [Candidatus Thorarchaeota archaeon]